MNIENGLANIITTEISSNKRLLTHTCMHALTQSHTHTHSIHYILVHQFFPDQIVALL